MQYFDIWSVTLSIYEVFSKNNCRYKLQMKLQFSHAGLSALNSSFISNNFVSMKYFQRTISFAIHCRYIYVPAIYCKWNCNIPMPVSQLWPPLSLVDSCTGTFAPRLCALIFLTQQCIALNLKIVHFSTSCVLDSIWHNNALHWTLKL